jgi:hypothetical protein
VVARFVVDNPTKSDRKDASPAYEASEEFQQQERTRLKKERFIEVFYDMMGSILHTCQVVGIDRSTFYEWRHTDKAFAKALENVEGRRNDEAESMLIQLVREKDGPSVRYFLDRRNPAYKPSKKMEVVTGDRTFEDLLWEQAERDRAIAEGRDPDKAVAEAQGIVAEEGEDNETAS